MVLLLAIFSMPNVGIHGLYLPNNVTLWFLVVSFILITIWKSLSSKIVYKGCIQFIFSVSILSVFLLILFNSTATWNSILMIALVYMSIVLFSWSVFQWQITHANFLKGVVLFCLIGFVHALVSIVQIHDTSKVLYHLTGYFPFHSNKYIGGIVGQVNMNATLMATIISATLYLVLHKSFYLYSKKIQLVTLVALGCSVYVLLLTGSRAGLIALFISLSVMFFAKRKVIFKYKFGLLIWGSVFALGVLGSSYLPGESVSKVDDVADKFIAVVSGFDARIMLYSSFLPIMIDNFWLGTGLGNFSAPFMAYVNDLVCKGEFYSFSDLEVYRSMKDPHNEIMFLIIQGGIGVLLIILYVFWHYFKRMATQRLSFSLGILALAAPFAIQSLLSYSFKLSVLHLFLLLFLLLYVIRTNKLGKQLALNKIQGNSLKWTLIIGFAFVLAFTWFSLKSIYDLYAFKERYFLVVEQTEEEINKLKYFEYASHHPYYFLYAEQSMHANLSLAIKRHNRYDLKRYLWWVDDLPEWRITDVMLDNYKAAKVFLASDISD